MKKMSIILMALVILLIPIFSAFAAAQGEGESSGKQGEKLTIAHVQGEWIWPVLDALGEQYYEKSGNTVEFLYIPAEGFSQWQQAQLLAGTEPDIFWGSEASLRESMFTNDQIIGLNAYYDEISPYTGKPWGESFLDGILRDCTDTTTGNTILGMPLSLVTVNLYYNRDIFKELGLPDKAPETYGELLEICKQVAASNSDIVPFSVMNGMSWNLGWMVGGFMEDLWINSGILEKLDIITPNGKLDQTEIVLGIKSGVIDPADPRMLDYFRYMKELSPYFNKGFNNMFWEYEKLFNDGRAAMQLNGSWYPNQHLLGEFPVNYGTGSLPYIDSSVSEYSRNQKLKFAINVGGADLVLTARAQEEGRADAAVDFMRFLSDPDTGAKYFAEKTMLLPVVKNVEVPAVMKGIVDAIGDELTYTFMGQIFNLTPEHNGAYQDMFKVFLEDNTTPEEFVQKFKKITLQAVDQYITENPDRKIEEYID